MILCFDKVTEIGIRKKKKATLQIWRVAFYVGEKSM